MKITYWWPLAFLILIPIIIIMYMLKQKAKDEKVASLFLWKEMIKNDRANTPWEKLKKNWLMILQILTLIVLIIALMSPFFMSSLVTTGKACVVIDSSASMSFMYDDNQTRFDKAKEEAISYVRKLKTGTEISLITSDESAMLLASKSQNKLDVIDAIRSLEVSTYPGDASEGVKMAKALAMDSKGLQTLVVTDTSVDCDTLDAMVVDVYTEAPNVGIEYVSHGYSNDKLTVLAKVTNFGNSEVKRDVSIYQNNILVENREVTIDAKSSEVVYFEDVSLIGSAYTVQLSSKDACDYDNICYDILADGSVSNVLLMTQKNLYLENALSLIPGINVTKSTDIDSFNDFATQEYDLYIFDSMLPETLPKQGNIIIFNQQCDEIAPIEGYYPEENLVLYPDECSTTMYLDGLSCVAYSPIAYKVPSYAHAFLSTDYYDSEGNFLGKKDIAFIGEDNGRTYAMIGFDLHNSDLPLYMEFPLLVYNLINESTSGGMLSSYVFDSGDGVAVSADVNESLPYIIKPDATRIDLTDYRYNYTNTDQYGVYTINQDFEDKTLASEFAVNYPFSESRIDKHPSMVVSGEEKVVTEVKGVFNLRNFIILLAMVMLCLEWIAGLRK
jgi:hypothetical protein